MNRFDPNFLTPLQVSEIFQIRLQTVQGLARSGKIPAIKIGRLWRFREQDIQRWIQSQYDGPHSFPGIYEKAREIVESL